MGGQIPGMLSWVSFLLFPHLLVCCGGVAGWNITPEIVNGFGTLLGPEKTSCRLVGCFFWLPNQSGQQTGHRFLVGGCWREGWGWLLFENCTVDASIFVVKLPRANGGCLGTRSR